MISDNCISLVREKALECHIAAKSSLLTEEEREWNLACYKRLSAEADRLFEKKYPEV